MPFLPAPKVTKKELENHLALHFDFGKLVSYKKLKKGFANSLYSIKTTKGTFVFKIAVRHAGLIDYEIKLLNSIKGLAIPKPIKTKNNQYTFNYKGYETFVYPFLPGQEKKKFDKKMLFEIGEFLGKLHMQAEGFSSPVKRIEYYAISKSRLESFIKESSHIKNLKIKKAISYIKNHALKYKLPSRLPKGAMHMDVKPENTLFKNGHLSGVLDFDNAYTGPLVFDLADTLMWFCSMNGIFNIENARVIYKGYISVRKLTKQENNAIFSALHNVFLAISLCGIELLAKKKLPRRFIVWIVDNLLEAEKNLKLTKAEFIRICQV